MHFEVDSDITMLINEFLLLVSCILIYMEVKAFSACVMYCYIHGRFKLDIILIINQI